MRYALDVQYIGKNYFGSQIQFENGKIIEKPTIQGELEKEHSNISNQIIDFEANISKQQVEFKECFINEINISKKNSKVYFAISMVFLFIILCLCAYILYILHNPVLT